MLNILTERQATAKLSTKTPKASVQTWYVKTKKKRSLTPYVKLRTPRQEAKFRRWTIWELPWAISNIS
jgi:hypothetical protein